MYHTYSFPYKLHHNFIMYTKQFHSKITINLLRPYRSYTKSIKITDKNISMSFKPLFTKPLNQT